MRSMGCLLGFCLSLVILSCQKHFHLQNRSAQLYGISDADAKDSALLNMLQPYRSGLDTQMSSALCKLDIPLTKAQPECLLGNFMADAQMEGARKIDHRVSVSIVNYGGIRLPYLAPGFVTSAQMYELMPFDNVLVIVEIPGSVLKNFCDQMARSGGWPVSGLNYVIKEKRAEEILVQGQPLNEHIVYRVAVNDYMAKGGDRCELLQPLKKRFTGKFVRDLLIGYLKNLQQNNRVLHPELENRVVHAE